MSHLSQRNAQHQRDEFIAALEDSYGRLSAESLGNALYNMVHMGCRYPERVEARVNQWKPISGTVAAGNQRSVSIASTVSANPPGDAAAVSTSPPSSDAAASVVVDVGDGTCEEKACLSFSSAEISLARRMKMRACEDDTLYVAKLNDSCQLSRVPVDYVPGESMDAQGEHHMDVFIDSLHVTHESAPQKKTAKHLAARSTYLRLLAAQESLGIAAIPTGVQLIREAKNHVDHAELVSKAFHEANKLSDTSKGSMLLKKMGYSGVGGLGKHGQGRAEPVVDAGATGNTRRGVGAVDASDLDRTKIETMLRDFIVSDEELLVFGRDLSKENRALLHTISERLGLVHRSHGQGDERQLIVQKRAPGAVAPTRAERRAYATRGASRRHGRKQCDRRPAEQQPDCTAGETGRGGYDHRGNGRRGQHHNQRQHSSGFRQGPRGRQYSPY